MYKIITGDSSAKVSRASHLVSPGTKHRSQVIVLPIQKVSPTLVKANLRLKKLCLRLAFTSVGDTFCIGKTMTCDLCFVPAGVSSFTPTVSHLFLPDWQYKHKKNRKHHLEVWQWSKAKSTQDTQLKELKSSVNVHLPLRDMTDVVIGRVCSLKQKITLK